MHKNDVGAWVQRYISPRGMHACVRACQLYVLIKRKSVTCTHAYVQGTHARACAHCAQSVVSAHVHAYACS